jgi:SMC interacting uncharacterized protein involved in chromosome segregation
MCPKRSISFLRQNQVPIESQIVRIDAGTAVAPIQQMNASNSSAVSSSHQQQHVLSSNDAIALNS